MNTSIKKQKELLDYKMKEFTRERSKVSELKIELEKNSLSHSGKDKIDNSLLKSMTLLKAIKLEMDEIRKELYGSWAPIKKGNEIDTGKKQD